ncbi:P-loop containing nucleoside triphosphate hydrolase protein [Piromyces finnis]|uniref:p-loop containing nucleoside triphosphate hydrolase protein n=1 Tax=Piromyces finnis TaxID=1754191 RepID=A0A1Y1VFD0_9FUNG|nr:P-loop containing nucleoside triphosphate hydrolase protein [Piromyces finnis]|eukprot:ORX54804.1 P-loop containing nucleoside triphosphate hydrolase protein [Piromyces finnis]
MRSDNYNDFNININNDDEIDHLLNKKVFSRKFTNFSLDTSLFKDKRESDDNIKRNLYKESIDKIKLYEEIFNSGENEENIIYYKDILKIRDIKRLDEWSNGNNNIYEPLQRSNKNLLSSTSLKNDSENSDRLKRSSLSKKSTTYSGFTSINNENLSSDYQFNIAFIGDSNVGKTELLQKECKIEQNDNFKNKQKIIKFYKKGYLINERACYVTYWDTPGDYDYLVDTIHLCSNMAGIAFIYDGTNFNSFLSLKKWVNEYSKYDSNNSHIFKIIFCNLRTFGEERTVQYNEGLKLAKSINADYIEFHEEVNAYEINNLFTQIIYGIVKDIPLKYENNQFILQKYHINLLKQREYHEQIHHFMNNKYLNIDKKDCTTIPDWLNEV